MSDPLEDIVSVRKPVGVVVTDSPGIGYGDFVLLTESERDALLAENQRLRDALKAARAAVIAYPFRNDDHQSDIDYYMERLRDRLAAVRVEDE